MNHDELSHLDAAYVLGALEPSERDLFEEHLRSCRSCAAAVRELEGLPALLGRVDASAFLDPPEHAAVPDTLLPALLREVRRGRRRRRGQLLVGAAAAVGVVVAGSLAWSAARDDGPSRDVAVVTPGPSGSPSGTTSPGPSGSPGPGSSAPGSPGPGSPGPRTVEMQQVGQQVLQASLTMEEVDWGTRLELTCSYDQPKEPGVYGEAPAPTYTLVVQTRSGRWEQVAAWRAVPGRTVTVPAATEATPRQITAVEVRTPAGQPVLELAS